MKTTIFVLLFIIFFLMALVGVYKSGYQDGRKKMLGELIDKKVISTDIYVDFLKLLNS